MKILHLTDLHFKDTSSTNYSISKIVNKIYEETKNHGIQYIYFTGDLVFSGKSYDDFLKAEEILLTQLSTKFNIPHKNIFITCGNHDVYRNQEMSVITEKLFNLKTEDELNSFLKDENQYNASLENIKNYLEFQKHFYEKNQLDDTEVDILSDLYTIHKRIFHNKNVYIVSINTAWRANDSSTDAGNLLFPSETLKSIILKLPKESFKILLLHHPLTDLRYWNRILIEDLIYDNFHALFYGHTHKSLNTSITKNSDGIVTVCSDASLSKINNYEYVGFTIINIDIDDMSMELKKFKIDSEFLAYPNGYPFNIQIPVDDKKRELLDFRKKVLKLYDIELNKAKEIFVNNSKSLSTFEDLFSEPILKTTSSTSINSIARTSNSAKTVTLKEIEEDFDNNYFVYGKDKFGKTAILYNLFVHYLKNISFYKVLPIYIDCGAKSMKELTIEDIFIRTYQINKSFFQQLKNEYHLRLLLDDYNKCDTNFKTTIADFITNNKNVTYVTTFDENILSDFQEISIDSTTHIKLYIHNLTSKHVRSITEKTLKCDVEKTEEIIKKIKSIFKQLNLPLNYWTVSLFLWIFNNTNEQNFHNNFELIQLYIDNLLDRQNIVTDKQIKIEYETLKIFLGELANHLVKEYHKSNYNIKYAKLVNFIEEYKVRNKRLVITTEALLTLIYEKGILKQVNEDQYTFRLKGVFEYFIAYYLKDNKRSRDEVIQDDHFYLSFGNELELVSGFNKRDSDFLTQILDKSSGLFKETNDYYKSIGNADEILITKTSSLNLKLSTYKKGIKTLVKKDIDTVSDEMSQFQSTDSDVRPKKMYDKIESISDHLEKVLFIMSRVYRNSDVTDDKLNNKVLDFILESACNLCFLIIDEHDEKADFDENVFKLFTNFIPLVIQNFLFDALAQNNLENIFLDKIEELKTTKGNELKIFVLYYMLVDLDIKNNKKYIDEAISYIKINSLKHASMYKLFSMLLFGSYSSHANKQFIETAALTQAKKIDNSKKNIETTLKTLQSISNKSKNEK
ncbi:metallophosphoesterase [Flavobacterium sp. MFBS3-15]|uniref:metallophosphoesterase n=1 Tax=Flavobacterium sp. MFBS3-15 TaxID=2989816 RepID=UPI0022354C4D|nr:metallophosphoesterase [Flavobacterium sp. MFBS3-15]MCW4470355.1 metallophosphoesterase [Flavobacterium sp. MFBS3-15]